MQVLFGCLGEFLVSAHTVADVSSSSCQHWTQFHATFYDFGTYSLKGKDESHTTNEIYKRMS